MSEDRALLPGMSDVEPQRLCAAAELEERGRAWV